MPYNIFGEWYDDGTDEPPAQDDFSSMFGMGAPNMFLPGDLNKYGEEEPYDAASLNRNLTGFKNLLAIRRDPFFNYLVSAETGADTFPYEQLTQPGNPYFDEYGGMAGMGPMGGMGGGGGMPGMGGGGGYGGGGGGGMFMTHTLDAARDSDNDVMRGIAQSIDAGMDPYTIQLNLAETAEGDQNALDAYRYAAEKMFEERSGQQRSMMQGGVIGDPSPLAQTAAKWGTISPLDEYNADLLPPEVEAALGDNQYLDDYAKQMRRQDRNISRLENKAQYGSYVDDDISDPVMKIGAALAGAGRQSPSAGAAAPPPPTRGDLTSIYGTLMTGAGGDRSRTPAVAAQPTTTGGRGGLSGGLLGGSIDALRQGAAGRRAQTAKDLPYVVEDQALDMGFVPTVTTKKRRTNKAGSDLRRAKTMQAQRQRNAANSQREVREWAAARVNQTGRTPQRDALKAQMEYLRAAGIGV